jgi:ABC-type phosphate transport system substrate-binding protein
MSIESLRTAASKTRSRVVRRARILLPILLYCLSTFAFATEMEIIANPKGASEYLDASTLRGIFGMRVSRWPDGTPIRVFVLPDDNPVHAEFAKRILNTYPHQLRRNWDRLVFSGTGNAPIQVKSEREMLDRIRSTPGSIGYVESGKESANVHVIKVR